ncbi:MAG: DNA-packaging protein, partial [Sphingobacteriia bacterium]|nr:DNA-packaging protein [Sphingobacteriia bacterium]
MKPTIIMDTLPKVLELAFQGIEVIINKSDWYAKFPNGSEIWFSGVDDEKRVEKILGAEYSTIYFNEVSEISYSIIPTLLSRLAEKNELTNRVFYDCNPPTKSHWAYKLFINHIDPIQNVPVKDTMYAYLNMNPVDNAENIDKDYIDAFLKNLPERDRRRFLDGEWLDDLEGALWKRGMIDAYRVQKAPSFRRVIIGVDPAVTCTGESNKTGIVVVGEGINKEIYILEDATFKASPKEWSDKVYELWKKYNCSCIVGEVNNGGDLVEGNILAANPYLNVKKVRASKGKLKRAEPVANLYEKGVVHHLDVFTELEDQMCSYRPDDGQASPDNLDAMVWAVTEIIGGGATVKI